MRRPRLSAGWGAGQVWLRGRRRLPGLRGTESSSTTTAVAAAGGCDRSRFVRERSRRLLRDRDLVAGPTAAAHPPGSSGSPGQFNRANARHGGGAASGHLPPLSGRPPVTGRAPSSGCRASGEVAGRVLHRPPSTGRDRAAAAGQEPGRVDGHLRPAGRGRIPRRVLRGALGQRPGGPTGYDPSWLADVPFERLVGRTVVATGERCRDLAVRLRYAEVDHAYGGGPASRGTERRRRGRRIRDGPGVAPPPVEFLGNYTAFATLRSRL